MVNVGVEARLNHPPGWDGKLQDCCGRYPRASESPHQNGEPGAEGSKGEDGDF
jgi:hypothetical protein